MTLLTADQILAADDLNYVEVEVEEWGGKVRLRDVTASGQMRLRAIFQDDKIDEAQKMCSVLAECLVNEQNEHLFNEQQIAALSEKSPKAILALFQVAIDLIGLSNKALNDAKKN